MSQPTNAPPTGERTPLISVIRTKSDVENHTRVSYFVGATMIMDMDIVSDILPVEGEVDQFALTQLLVTPHELLATLADVYALAKGREVSGPRWDAVISKVGQVLGAP